MKNSMQDPVLLAVNQVCPTDPNRPMPLATGGTVSAPRKRGWAMAVIVLGLAACVVLGVVMADLGRKVVTDGPKVERVLEDFMSAMAQRETQTAYALFSTRVKNQFPRSDLDGMVEGASYCLFDGFEEISINSLVFNATFNNRPDEPQGVTARVQGIVSYEGDYTGTLTAILQQEGDEYRLVNISVVVPPAKFERRRSD